jgi:hypothetical protein
VDKNNERKSDSSDEARKTTLKQLLIGVISNEGWLTAGEVCSLVKTTYTQTCDLESVNAASEELTREGNVEVDRSNQTFRRKFKAVAKSK